MVVLDLVWTTDPGNSSAVGYGEEAFVGWKYGWRCLMVRSSRLRLIKFWNMDFLLNFMNVTSIELTENCQNIVTSVYFCLIKYRSLWEDYLVVCPYMPSQLPWYAVLCYAVLCPGVLCCAVLCYAMLCCAVLCCAVLCCAVLCCAMLCYAMLCYAMLCYAMQYAMLCYAMLCYAMLCCVNLCNDSCPLIGWIAFIRLTIIELGDKTSYCTPFGSARVQKLFNIALIVHIYIRVFSVSNTIFGRLL